MDIKNLIGFPAYGGKPLGSLLNEELYNESWTSFHAAVAFVKRSGVKHLVDSLQKFNNQGVVKFIVGIDLFGTSIEGIETLTCSIPNGEIWIYHNELTPTFHPKLYVFSNESNALVIVGSGNLTEGGLYTNEEVSLQITLDLSSAEELKFYENLMSLFDLWSTGAENCSILLDDDNLLALIENGYLVPEKFVTAKANVSVSSSSSEAEEKGSKKLFGKKIVKSSKGRLIKPASRVPDIGKTIDKTSWKIEHQSSNISYLMTLQQTDAGSGQTTPGKSKRSPEIFIPLSAKKANEGFWGWPDEFNEDPEKINKFDRREVPFLLNGKHFTLNMMTWPDRSDFRLRSSELRNGCDVGDIIKITQSNLTGVAYEIEFIVPSDDKFDAYSALCDQIVRNSKKRWGYIS